MGWEGEGTKAVTTDEKKKKRGGWFAAVRHGERYFARKEGEIRKKKAIHYSSCLEEGGGNNLKKDAETLACFGRLGSPTGGPRGGKSGEKFTFSRKKGKKKKGAIRGIGVLVPGIRRKSPPLLFQKGEKKKEVGRQGGGYLSRFFSKSKTKKGSSPIVGPRAQLKGKGKKKKKRKRSGYFRQDIPRSCCSPSEPEEKETSGPGQQGPFLLWPQGGGRERKREQTRRGREKR